MICRTEGVGVHKECNRIGIAVLTDEQERDLDKHTSIDLNLGNRTIKINSDNLICYGDVDFTTNSSDYNQVAKLIKNDIIAHIPTDYNYNLHCCISPNKSYRTVETTDVSRIVQYFHGKLGKPKKVIIFKEHIERKY